MAKTQGSECAHGYSMTTGPDCPQCAAIREKAVRKCKERRERRDQFATAALGGLSGIISDGEDLTNVCFEIADRMLVVSDERAEDDAKALGIG